MCFCNVICPVHSCISKLACLQASPKLILENAGEGIVGLILSASVACGDLENVAFASSKVIVWQEFVCFSHFYNIFCDT